MSAYEYWTGTGWQSGSSSLAVPIVVRLAPRPTGPWGAPITVATYREYPSLYGGFLHPDSTGSDIYFTLTQYDRYNVSLMHTRLPANAIKSARKP